MIDKLDAVETRKLHNLSMALYHSVRNYSF